MENNIYEYINGYDSLYKINRLGDIISIKTDIKEECKLNPYLVKGYPTVKLYINGRQTSKQLLIHRLVAIQFIQNPENKPQVNHIDGNKLNYNYKNLEWVTARENQTHMINKSKKSSSHTGVSWNKKRLKWSSQIWVNNKILRLGFYNNETDASNAYKMKLKELNITNKYAK